MRVLFSTFGGDDVEKVLCAMRALPYDQLVLIGPGSAQDSDGYSRLCNLEEMSGHKVDFELAEGPDFMSIVDEVSEAIERRLGFKKPGSDNHILMNISGGDKLLGDASLFAAFRMGVEAYHCDKTVTKLPVLRRVTAKDRFTPTQSDMILGIGDGPKELDRLYSLTSSVSRQATERVIRELKRGGLIKSEARGGRVFVELTDTGLEVLRALKTAATQKSTGM